MAVIANRLNRYQVQLSWDLGELRNVDPADITAYKVYRSIDGASASLLASVSVRTYTDTDAFDQPTRHYLYEVKASTPSGDYSLGTASPSEKVATGLSGVAKTVLEAEIDFLSWGFEHFGETTTVWQRKEVGEKCPRCYDPDRGIVPQEDCEECYGTGFIGGYDAQTNVQALFRTAESGLITGVDGLVYEKTPTVYFLPTYIFSPNDVVVRETGERYLLGRERHVRLQNQIAFQRFEIDLLPTESILYRLSV